MVGRPDPAGHRRHRAAAPAGGSADSLGATGLSRGWESGAAAPISFRGLLGMILSGLPPDALEEVGRLLTGCGTAAGGGPQDRYPFLVRLFDLRHPALDAVPARPVVGVNFDAPQRVIAEAVEQLVRGWKEQEGIPERRRRDDKLDDYLAAWDRREGWTGDGYDGTRERTLAELARDLRVPLSTAANRYRSAFRLIVGRDYSPALWARVLGSLKVCAWLGPGELPRRSLRRPWRDRQARPVPESVLQPPGEGGGPPTLLNTAGAAGDEVAYVEFLLDAQELIGRGRSNEEIVAALGMTSPHAGDAIEFLRRRRQDRL